MSSDGAQRRSRSVERLASEYEVDVRVGDGRYAAVNRRDGQTELVRGETVRALLDRGELLALRDLDYDGAPNR